MRKLEEFVIEKLRVTKRAYTPNLIAILESKDKQEFDSRSNQLLEYLKNDSDLPIADLEDFENGIKKRKLSKKYENGDDIFLYVQPYERVFYGIWDNMCVIRWFSFDNAARCYDTDEFGFNELSFDYQELSESGGVFIITENEELMRQIDILKKKVEPLT